jgi:photosystem II stability/assembly factor-like uncharacterized protein
MVNAALFLLCLLTAMQPPVPRFEPQASGVTARLRGISAVSATVAWASGASGTVLRTTDGGRTWQRLTVPGAEALDFRDIEAMDERVAWVLSIGPGEASRIYKTVDAGATWQLQFQNTDPGVFLDAMEFWDDTHGVALSDSVDGRFVILMTGDGGATWMRVPADRLPPSLPGEGAFAASGTNIFLGGQDQIWIGLGSGRVLRSPDKGRTWTIVRTPVAAASAAGVFSIAFRSPLRGVVVGGDYQKETDAVDNAAVTTDGGASWTLVKGLSGYRSVVAPLGAGASWIAIGPSGADVSDDDGATWTPVATEGYDTFSVVRGSRTGWAAGSGGRIAKVTW